MEIFWFAIALYFIVFLFVTLLSSIDALKDFFDEIPDLSATEKDHPSGMVF